MNVNIIKKCILPLAFALAVVPAQAAIGFARPAQAPASAAPAAPQSPAIVAQPSAGSCDPFQIEVNRLIQAQDLRGNIIKSVKTMLGQFVAQGSVTAVQVDAIAEEIANVAYPRMKTTVEQCLRQNLSVDELREINAFYATPAGRKMNSLTPALMDAGSQTMQQPDVQSQIQQIMQKHLGK